MKFDKYQQLAINKALDDKIKSLFITGTGGSGKSAIIKELTSRMQSKSYILLAPTQSASQLIGGTTLHSFFKIRPTVDITASKEDNVISFYLKELGEYDDVSDKIIIIDEASMLGEEALVNIFNRIRPKKLILFGDPQQLNPIKDNSVDWAEYCEDVVLLQNNYRATNKQCNEAIAKYRNTCKLSDNIEKVKLAKLIYDEDTFYIAHKNKTLSDIQKHLLGYTHAKLGDKVTTFGNCNDSITTNVNNSSKNKPYFINNDTVTITSTPLSIDDGLWECEVRRLDEAIIISKYKKKPKVIVGDYEKYKLSLTKRFKTAQRLQNKMEVKYGDNLKHKINNTDSRLLKDVWINYFDLKNSPYARHHQFTTTYKAQGKAFKKVVICWNDLPSKAHKFVAISRAIENIKIII